MIHEVLILALFNTIFLMNPLVANLIGIVANQVLQQSGDNSSLTSKVASRAVSALTKQANKELANQPKMNVEPNKSY